MAPRTQHSPAEVQELIKLIHNYKVLFLPPGTEQHLEPWQLPYRDVFEQIAAIEKITFKDYPPINHFDKAEAAKKKLLVREIQVNAAQCRRERENEAGWINNVASLVLKRLNGFDFVCQCCKKHLWKPDFLALPANPMEALELRRKHNSRTLCKCSDVERANAIRPNITRPSIFSNKSDERVLHRDAELQAVVVDQKYKRPDRVFGLSLTDSFVPYYRAEQEGSPLKEGSPLENASPFNAGFTLYPFLIVEAKSEKGGPGWASIERQSALAIRSCLKLQIKLESQGHGILRPKVWFMGFQGDEWRLYCAIPRGDETSVIDCWHGNVQDADRALQLLIIVDWICSWARDVYRPAVLQCLSRGSEDSREMTPAETLYSSQGDESGFVDDLYTRSLAYRSSRQSSILPEVSAHGYSAHSSREADDPMDIVPIEPEEHQSNEPDNNGGMALPNDASPTVECRRISARLEKWRHLQVPEVLVALTGFLDSILPAKSHKEAAGELLDVLLHDENRATVSLLALSQLLGHSDDQVQSSDLLGDEPVLILLVCQNWFNSPDWQIVRAFTCMSCTPEAARQLAMLAERNGFIHSLSYWRAHKCRCLSSAVSQFELLDVRQSTQAAWSRDIFCLTAGANGAEDMHLGWSRFVANASQDHIDNLQSILAGLGDCWNSSRLVELPQSQANAAPVLRQLIDATAFNNVSGLLVKRSSSWSENGALWCYLMFEQRPGDGLEEVGAVAREEARVYAEGSLSTEDEALLRAWGWRSE